MRDPGGTSLAVLVLVGSGCSAVCKGPACEDDWPVTRVAVHRGADLGVGTRDVWRRAGGSFDGATDAGARWSVAASGSRLVFGQPEAGRVVTAVDRTTSGALTPQAEWFDPDGSAFGAAVAIGDVDGDDLFDLWVSAPDAEEARGAVRLFRSAEVVGGDEASAASVTIVGGSLGDRLGERMVVCGDLTGDGLPELAVSAPWFAATDALPDVPALAGAVILVRSDVVAGIGGRLLAWEAGHVWWGEGAGAGAGEALDCDDDVTGDGRIDLVVGAPWNDGSTGRVYVIGGEQLPPSGPLDGAATHVLDAPEPGTWYGAAVATLHLDDDLTAELAIGAPGFDGGRGRVHVHLGSEMAALVVAKQLAVIESDRPDADHVGRWLLEGDADGDGLDDLLVGAPDYREGVDGFDTGRAWLWLGNGRATWPRTFDVSSADVTFTGSQPFQRLGRGALVHDLDGDGLDELVFPTRTTAP